ncbi:MAG: DUF1854 domain-containing protein, partial [Gammaproteobacteria bacterium]
MKRADRDTGREGAVRAPGFGLSRDAFGRLVLTLADGIVHESVVPARAFPILEPQGGLALMSAEGHELVWIDDPSALPEPTRALIEEELASREFMPEIGALLEVSSFATPSTWRVATD